MTHTAETIKVHVLDTAKMSEVFNTQVQKEKPDDMTYKVWHKLAVVTEPVIGLLTDECVGTDKQPFCFAVYGERKLENGHTEFECIPKYEFKLYLGDLEPYIGQTVTLKEFMADRYHYNARIIGNENEWLRVFNK